MTGSRRGPDPKPCGTRAAYRRHRANGEPPCEPCMEALAVYNSGRENQRSWHDCPGCKRPTRAQRLCGDCSTEAEFGLHGGDWVVRGGIKVWVPWKKAENWWDVA